MLSPDGIELRDRRKCAFPGCVHTHFLDAHHIEHWADGGDTKLDNLVLLCRRHHTYLHEHEYSVVRDEAGRRTFVAPSGKIVPHAPSPPTVQADVVEWLAAGSDARGDFVDEMSLVPPYYNGEPVQMEPQRPLEVSRA